MKRVATLLALHLLAAVACRSQMKLCFDSTAVKIDSITTQAAVASGGNGTTTVIFDVVVWRTVSGRNYYSIPPESIQFAGPGEPIDAMPTPKLFDILATNAVSVGIARGYTLCPVECGIPASTRVAAAECLQRSGSGVATRFTTCSPAQCCYREYNVCCTAGPGSPTITLFNRVGSGCPQSIPPCQSTCQ